MAFLLMFFAALLAAVIVLNLMQRLPRLPRRAGDWGEPVNNDPRLAAAAMLYAVAAEDGPITPGEERQILTLLETRIGVDKTLARTCLTGGRRLADRTRGDLSSRLHQLKAPILTHCSVAERNDLVDMLRAIAGSTDESHHAVRDGLGRLAATLRNG